MLKQLSKIAKFLNNHRSLFVLSIMIVMVAVIGLKNISQVQAAATDDNAPGQSYNICPISRIGQKAGNNSWTAGGYRYYLITVTIKTASTGLCELSIANAGPGSTMNIADIKANANGAGFNLFKITPNVAALNNTSDFFRQGTTIYGHGVGGCTAPALGACINLQPKQPKAKAIWLGVPKGLMGVYRTTAGSWLYNGQYDQDPAAAPTCSYTPNPGASPPAWRPIDTTPPLGANDKNWPIWLNDNCQAAGYVNDGAIASMNGHPILCIGMSWGTLADFGIANLVSPISPGPEDELGINPPRCGSTLAPLQPFGPGGNIGQFTNPNTNSVGNAGFDFIQSNCNPGFVDNLDPANGGDPRYSAYTKTMDCSANQFRWYRDYWLGKHTAASTATGSSGENLTGLLGTDASGDLNPFQQLRLRLKSTIVGGSESIVLTARYPIKPQGFTLDPNAKLSDDDPTDENPSNIYFDSSVDAKLPVGVATVNGITLTRDFYITKYNGATTHYSISGPANGVRNFNAGSNTFAQITKAVSGLQAGDQFCATTTVDPASGDVDAFGNVTNPGDPQTDPGNCITINNRPYFKFYNNDVLVGGFFNGGDCSTLPDGGIIKAQYKRKNFNGSDKYAGSGVQFAAQAYYRIRQFASSNITDNNPNASKPIALTFGNINVPQLPSANPLYSGGFFGACMQLTDYFATNTVAQTTPTPAPLDLGSLANNQYYYKSTPGTPLEITNGSNLPDGKHLFIYVYGDVYLNTNISYANAGGGWTDPKDIPLVYLIVKGNIFIDGGVTQLDGIYVAQPKTAIPDDTIATGGLIYTCAKSTGPYSVEGGGETAPFLPGPAGVCYNNDLTVNGTFIAQEVKFLRTGHSLRDSGYGENPFLGNPRPKAAEMFNFSPEAYVANFCKDKVPAFTTLCDNNSTDKTINSLPPIL